MAVRLLVCGATLPEVSAFLLDDEPAPSDEAPFLLAVGSIAVAVTGVGVPVTLLTLPPLLTALRPALVLNIGIAGAYPNSGLALGAVAMARSEILGDIGFELPATPGFRHVADAPFGGAYRRLSMHLAGGFRSGPNGSQCVEADACTVNACTGTLRTGLMRERLFGVEMESMEGAAVAMACDAAGVPACEVRAISNIAANRDMKPENIKLAIESLRGHLRACRQR